MGFLKTRVDVDRYIDESFRREALPRAPAPRRR
jgi:hypothetical protein